MLGQEPPMYLRSTTATRSPRPAKAHAARVDPVPPPRMMRSYSSSCRCGDGGMPFVLILIPSFHDLFRAHRLPQPGWAYLCDTM